MANLPETISYPTGIYQLELNDPVLGGAGGIDNLAPTQLASRTGWLRDKANRALRMDELKSISGSYTVLVSDVNKVLQAQDLSNIDITLPTLSSMSASGVTGQPFTIQAFEETTFKSILMVVSGGDKIYDGTATAGYSSYKIRPGQRVVILPLAGGWYVIYKSQNVPTGIKLDSFGSSVPQGYLACNGSAVSRTGYADLFAEIGTVYGAGDGSSTFTLPDATGRFFRATGGNAASLGTPQADEIKAHVHTYQTGNTQAGADKADGGSGLEAPGGTTNSTGGVETRPINLAVNVYIKY